MKKILYFFLFLLPFISLAQKDSSGIGIPMKNGRIFYEKEFTAKSDLQKNELYARALNWLNTSFRESKEKTNTADRKTGMITRTGIFRIPTSDNGHFYLVKVLINIAVQDDRIIVRERNYYEKPVEPGITNDYSKLEYRWWDFRQGKPWSSEDKLLFEGVRQNSEALLASFEKEVVM